MSMRCENALLSPYRIYVHYKLQLECLLQSEVAVKKLLRQICEDVEPRNAFLFAVKLDALLLNNLHLRSRTAYFRYYTNKSYK